MSMLQPCPSHRAQSRQWDWRHSCASAWRAHRLTLCSIHRKPAVLRRGHSKVWTWQAWPKACTSVPKSVHISDFLQQMVLTTSDDTPVATLALLLQMVLAIRMRRMGELLHSQLNQSQPQNQTLLQQQHIDCMPLSSGPRPNGKRANTRQRSRHDVRRTAQLSKDRTAGMRGTRASG